MSLLMRGLRLYEPWRASCMTLVPMEAIPIPITIQRMNMSHTEVTTPVSMSTSGPSAIAKTAIVLVIIRQSA